MSKNDSLSTAGYFDRLGGKNHSKKATHGATMPLNFLSQTPFQAVKLALEMTVTLAMERTFK